MMSTALPCSPLLHMSTFEDTDCSSVSPASIFLADSGRSTPTKIQKIVLMSYYFEKKNNVSREKGSLNAY